MFFTKGQINQILTALIVCLINISIGLCFSWPSLVIQTWLSPDSAVPMTVVQSSWVVSYIAIGCLISALVSGTIANTIGRKVMLIGSSPVLVIAWLLVIFGRSVEMLYLSRFLQGFALGTVLTVSPLYFGEIADQSIRGFICTLYFGAFFAGNLIEYVVGYFLPSQYVAYFNLAIPAGFFVLFFNIPETPYYLMIKGAREEVNKSLEFFRVGKSKTELQEEFDAVENAVEECKNSKISMLDIFSSYQSRKALLIVMSTATIRILTGAPAFLSFASYIFETAGTSLLSPNGFAILIGAVQFIGFFFAAPSVDHLGRRFLLMWSTLICGICQVVLGIYFYLKEFTYIHVQTYSYIVPTALSVYFFFLAVGTGSVVGVLKNELFPLNTRGLASSLAGFAGTIAEFICLKFYQLIMINAGMYWNHVIFAAVAAYGFILYLVLLPETKGLTFQEIQDLLAKKPPKKQLSS